MIGTRTKEIGGITYEVQQHPATRAMRLLPRLLKFAGPLVGAATTATQAGGAAKVDVEALAKVVGTLFEKLSPDEFVDLLKELLSFTAVVEPGGGKMPLWPVFDLRMQGRPDDVLELAIFAVEVNFSRFLERLKAVGGGTSGTPAAT